MKNITRLITLVAVFGITAFNAQDKETPHNLETQFAIGNLNQNVIPNLKYRYYGANGNRLRITSSFEYDNSKTEILEVGGDGVGSLERTNSLFQFGLGYEKVLTSSNDKVKPYIGAGAILGIGNRGTFGSRTDSLVFINDFNFTSNSAVRTFGIQLMGGVDFHVTEQLYIGTEIGYQFMSLTQKRGEFVTTDASSTTNANTTTPIAEERNQSFDLFNLGVIRVGWSF